MLACRQRRSTRLLRALGVLALTLALWLAPRVAQANPDLAFRTIETEHFIIHYHVGEEELADRVALLAERAYERMTLELAHEVRLRTHIILTDTTDASNGFANATPFPAIRLFAPAPDTLSVLGSYDDWIDILVTHEFVHVVHIDTVHGLPRLLNALLGFGVVGKVSAPNIVQPRWIVEGLATMYESKLGAQGRHRSALFDMFMRVAILEGRFQTLDQINSGARVFPGGTSVYLYGLHLLHYIAAHYGADKLAEMSHLYGGRLVPWGINRALREVIGVDFETLEREYQTHLERRFYAEARRIRARGLRQGRRLTFTASAGSSGAHTRFPVWSPDDQHIYFFDDDGHRQAGIRRISAEGTRIREGLAIGNQGKSPDIERVIDMEDNSRPSFVGPNEDQIIFDMVGVHDQRYRWSDLYRWKGPSRRGREQLTFGMRARAPDVSPDGRTVAFVRNDSGQSRIAFLALDTLEVRELEPLGTGQGSGVELQQAYDPDWHPSGTKVAYSAWRDGGWRDIYVHDLETQTTERITADRAQDNSPEWSPDGRWLLFSSDRSGVFNLYAFDTESGQTRQVSNVLGGAFEPAISHDGERIAYVGYSSTGYDLWAMDFDPARFMDPPEAITDWPVALDPEPGYDADDPSAGPPPSANAKPYRFYRTFFPRTLVPSAADFELGTLLSTLSLSLAMEDVIGYHSLVGSFEWLTDLRLPAGSVSYRFSRLFPSMFVGFGQDYRARTGFTRYAYDPPASAPGTDPPYRQDLYLERVLAFNAGLSVPVLRMGRHDARASLSYSYVHYTNLDAADAQVDPNAPASLEPEIGGLSTVNLGLTYDNREGVRYSWGNETGRRLAVDLSLSDPALGGRYSDLRASGNYTEALRMPWVGHQVLALRLAGGASSQGLARRGSFRLGGLPEDQDVIQTILARSPWGEAGSLRGYDPSEFGGRYFGVLQLEYRVPILDVDRGLGTTAAFFERLVLVAFTDWGMAWTDPITIKDLAGSVGATLISSFKFGYGERLALFFQYAHGLDPEVGIDYFRVFVGRGF